MRLITSLILIVLWGFSLNAQELQLNIQVNTPNRAQLKEDPKVFQTLEAQITEFMNSTQWTNVTYAPEERIKGMLQLTISKAIPDKESMYTAELSIQAVRPVYGTDYETQVFFWMDKDVVFGYKEFQPIRKTQTSFTDNLSSILSYYAYMIIGMDFDTFSELGGDEYFRTAESIVNAAANSAGDDGWKEKTTSHNRYSLVNDAFNPSLRQARKAMYMYHRKGLDIMSAEAETGRSNISGALSAIQQASRSKSNSTYVYFVTNAKIEEIINIYNVADTNEKRSIYATLIDINPSNARRIEVLK